MRYLWEKNKKRITIINSSSSSSSNSNSIIISRSIKITIWWRARTVLALIWGSCIAQLRALASNSKLHSPSWFLTQTYLSFSFGNFSKITILIWNKEKDTLTLTLSISFSDDLSTVLIIRTIKTIEWTKRLKRLSTKQKWRIRFSTRESQILQRNRQEQQQLNRNTTW